MRAAFRIEYLQAISALDGEAQYGRKRILVRNEWKVDLTGDHLE